MKSEFSLFNHRKEYCFNWLEFFNFQILLYHLLFILPNHKMTAINKSHIVLYLFINSLGIPTN